MLLKGALLGGDVLNIQVNAISEETELVTLTAGGNDIGFVQDMGSLYKGEGIKHSNRDWDGLRDSFRSVLRAAHSNSSKARILVTNYLRQYDPNGDCPRCDKVNFNCQDSRTMRNVQDKLANVTADIVNELKDELDGKVELVDVAKLSIGHSPCDIIPYASGNTNTPAQWHPNALGTTVVADAIVAAYWS